MILLLIITLLTVAVDQISKYIFLTRFPDLVFYNDAIAFSLSIPWYLPWITILVLIGLMLVQHMRSTNMVFADFRSMIAVDRLFAVSVGLISGGGIGNLIDRFSHNGRVIDFIDVKFWPVFNLADSAIVVGVLLFLFRSYIKRGVQS